MDLQVWANLLTQMCASALPRNDKKAGAQGRDKRHNGEN